jgi:hypothetical protein
MLNRPATPNLEPGVDFYEIGLMAAAWPEFAAAMGQRIAEWINTPGGDAVSGIVAISANADDRKEETSCREYA